VRPSDNPVTLGLIGISVMVFLFMNVGDQETVIRLFLISEYFQPVLPEILSGQLWRIFTPIFLHFGIFHIVFNMMWTWELGRIIEQKQGRVILLSVCLLSGAVANLAQYWVSGPVFGGMSGVVYALFGYIWIQGLTNLRFGIRLNPAIVYLMMGWFVVCWTGILEKLFGLSVANAAHTAGLVSGVLISLLITQLFGIRRAR